MNRKKYKVTIKMTTITSMNHEQISKKKAKEDVKKIIENSTKDSLNQIFNSEPIFVYKIEII